MKVQQRDIVELNFELPDGKFKVHPALVISNEHVLEAEDIFYALMISSANCSIVNSAGFPMFTGWFVLLIIKR